MRIRSVNRTTVCKSHDGRLLLVGTSDVAIRDVRFLRISGTTTGDGECIRIDNNNGGGSSTGPGGVIAGVVYRDVTVEHTSTANYGMLIRNQFGGAAKTISDVRFENFSIISPSDTAFVAIGEAASASDNPLGPISNVTWRGGGIVSPALPPRSSAMSVERLTNGVFEGLALAGTTDGHPSVVVGDTIDPFGTPGCRNLAFVDVAIAGVGPGETGIRLDRVESCVWVRGSVAEADPANPAATAFRTSAATKGGAVAWANLGGIANGFILNATNPVWIGANRTVGAAANGRRYPFELGIADAAIATGAAIVATSGVSLGTPPGSSTPPAALNTVTGNDAGDLIVLGWNGAAGTPPVQAIDGTNLRLAGNADLDRVPDTLTMLKRGPMQWAELARSNNL